MEKEIHEQPDAIAHTLAAMTDSQGLLATPIPRDELAAIDGIVMLAAGTSHYAQWWHDIGLKTWPSTGHL